MLVAHGDCAHMCVRACVRACSWDAGGGALLDSPGLMNFFFVGDFGRGSEPRPAYPWPLHRMRYSAHSMGPYYEKTVRAMGSAVLAATA